MTRFAFTVRATLALVATLAGCGGNSSSGRLSAPSATPPPVATSTYAITVYSGDNQSGPAYMTHPSFSNGQLLLPEPLCVEVRDGQGNLAPDFKVQVSFRVIPGPYGILGVEGLGDTTTGCDQWQAAPNGSGRAAVGAIPNYPGTWQVTAQVTPLQTSAGNVPASSNVVVFTVTGAP